MKPLVAIIGRPNVGKSTLFNLLVQRREAIVDPTAGVTRDRHYGHAEWAGRSFALVDTGGWIEGSDDIFEGEIRRQVEVALEECNFILFLVDVEAGITHDDQEIARLLRKQSKPIVLIANKTDTHERMAQAAEFYSLGFGEPMTVSSINGLGTGDALDALVAHFPEPGSSDEIDPFEGKPRLAIVGRPNVGKSSITNALFEAEVSIVTDIAGTTRDTVNSHFNKFDMDFVLLDTAGMRKKGKVNENLEFYSNMRTVRTIEDSDVCMLVIDATQGFESQDQNILHVILTNKKGLVVVINKWDLVSKDTHTMKTFEEQVRIKMRPFVDVPIIFTSAISKQRVLKAVETCMEVQSRRSTRLGTSKLNDIILPIVKERPPPMYKGKIVKIKFISQLPTKRPQFVLYCNMPQYVKEPYERFVENQFRKHFDLTGIPIDLYFRKKV
jgi:GTP-binding protein